jgi:hypothetical protein
MKTMLAVAFLALSSCVPWGNYRAVPSGGVTYDPITGNQVYHAGVTLAPGFHMDDESKEIFRGRMGSSGADAGSAARVTSLTERVTTLTGEMKTERAAARALRDQIVHIEGDLSTRTRERDERTRELADRTRELNERTADVAKLRVELKASDDHYRYFEAVYSQYGLPGVLALLLLAIWALSIRYRQKPAKSKAATED